MWKGFYEFPFVPLLQHKLSCLSWCLLPLSMNENIINLLVQRHHLWLWHPIERILLRFFFFFLNKLQPFCCFWSSTTNQNVQPSFRRLSFCHLESGISIPTPLLSSFPGDLMQLFHLPAGMSQIFMDKSPWQKALCALLPVQIYSGNLLN